MDVLIVGPDRQRDHIASVARAMGHSVRTTSSVPEALALISGVELVILDATEGDVSSTALLDVLLPGAPRRPRLALLYTVRSEPWRFHAAVDYTLQAPFAEDELERFVRLSTEWIERASRPTLRMRIP